MRPPSGSKVHSCASREAGVIETKLCTGFLVVELESHDRVKTRSPILLAPRLNDALVGNELDVAPGYHASENGKRTAHFLADFGRGAFHDKISRLTKLLLVGERFIHALPRRFENHFLMDALTIVQYPISIALWTGEAEGVLH